MITFEWIGDVIDTCYCFICQKGFINGDVVGEFFGGMVHGECLDKELKENRRGLNEGSE